MTENERRRIFEEALQVYGGAHQAVKCVEEMSELQKELCKYLDAAGRIDPENPDAYCWIVAKKCRDKVLEETADVLITLEQVKIIFDFGEELEAKIDGKLEWLKARMETAD